MSSFIRAVSLLLSEVAGKTINYSVMRNVEGTNGYNNNELNMFEGIRALLGLHPRRSEIDLKIDQALENAEALDHYFFFSDHADAEAAADRLQDRGWTIQSLTLHAEEQKWLLHVRQPGKPENLHELQTELDLFADEHHGEYDGWQAPGATEHL